MTNDVLQSKTTDPQDDGGGQMMFLDRLGVDCGPGRALTKFHLARRPGNKDVYEYSCAEPKGGAGMQCRNAQTRLNDEAGGGKRTMYLDRHFVECHKDEVCMHTYIHHTLFQKTKCLIPHTR